MPIEPPVESPSTLEEAYARLAEGGWRPIAGGTDLMVELSAERGEPPARVLDLWRLDALRGVALEPRALSIGALTTYSDLRRSAPPGGVVPRPREGAGRGRRGGRLDTGGGRGAPPAGCFPPPLRLGTQLGEFVAHRGQLTAEAGRERRRPAEHERDLAGSPERPPGRPPPPPVASARRDALP